ncbi:4-hydroxy-3-methylbut-2-enyl diphosphate reductase [Lactiplantibacillus fabifermentans T30PCM01]|uniref:4-hydroxy-3-methylbut-2-enyl diphosphate reductase n=1 Tax=Lactiplantibacillus fabifermentans T30PCM01 TaxID=1400520 RepID=W6T7Y8_9LACO|nr:4-hydroxy-3-methylbut-2-enyl diphosphate reductase [Lactiplantibacillus fabifermentans]ETY74461.1 4-hydroxy-3-methylbut-2-enyl diphosphate reductase [Lactiplantibacillus fabifermentans T30PCM01]
MKLWLYVGKNVKLRLNSGQIIQGKVWDWNDPEDIGEQEIVIGDHRYGESQIMVIEAMD